MSDSVRKPSLYEISICDDETICVEMCRAGLMFEVERYGSLTDLLLALLYADGAEETRPTKNIALAVAPGWREKAFKVLDAVYVEKQEESALSPSQRYMLYQQERGNLTAYTVKHRKDRILEGISQELYEREGKLANLNTFEKIVHNVSKFDINVPVRDYFGFSEAIDLDNWVLQQVIDSGVRLAKCKNCGRYFAPKRKGAEFCSSVCKTVCSQKAKYCGQIELVRKTNEITAVFARRAKSELEYVYLPRKAKITGDYDADFLFRAAKCDRNEPLGKEQFRKLEQAYVAENEKRRIDFVAVYKLYAKGDLLLARVEEKKTEYITWLENVHQQIKAVSKAKRYFNWES